MCTHIFKRKTLSEGDVIGEKSKEGTEAWCEQSQKTDTLLEIPKWWDLPLVLYWVQVLDEYNSRLLETRDQVRKDELLVKHMNSILSMSTPLEMPETIKEESEDEWKHTIIRVLQTYSTPSSQDQSILSLATSTISVTNMCLPFCLFFNGCIIPIVYLFCLYPARRPDMLNRDPVNDYLPK